MRYFLDSNIKYGIQHSFAILPNLPPEIQLVAHFDIQPVSLSALFQRLISSLYVGYVSPAVTGVPCNFYFQVTEIKKLLALPCLPLGGKAKKLCRGKKKVHSHSRTWPSILHTFLQGYFQQLFQSVLSPSAFFITLRSQVWLRNVLISGLFNWVLLVLFFFPDSFELKQFSQVLIQSHFHYSYSSASATSSSGQQ